MKLSFAVFLITLSFGAAASPELGTCDRDPDKDRINVLTLSNGQHICRMNVRCHFVPGRMTFSEVTCLTEHAGLSGNCPAETYCAQNEARDNNRLRPMVVEALGVRPSRGAASQGASQEGGLNPRGERAPGEWFY